MSIQSYTAVGETIIKLLLDLPPEERAAAMEVVRFNGLFCCACGTGSAEHPNPNCQCWNDE